MRNNQYYCVCGCGKETKNGNRYIFGHNRRKPSDIERVCSSYLKKEMSIFEISRELGYSENRVKRCLRQGGVKTRNHSQASFLAGQKDKFYMQTEEGKQAHSLIMKGHSCNRSRQYNREFFKSFNKSMAYVLGFIFADGCLSKENKLMFAIKDKVLLEKINHAFNSDVPIRGYKNDKYWKLEFRSHEMARHLITLGVTPNKTFTLGPPNKLPPDLFPAFIRGFFDGDGCFAYHKTYDTYKSIIANGSFEILEWIHNVLPTQQGVIYKQKNKNCFELRYALYDTIRLGNFIYNGLGPNDIYLPRKFDIFQKIKNRAYSS